MPSAKRLWIAVVMLLVFWSPSAIAIDQPALQERKGNPSSRSAVPQEQADTPHASSPMLVAQWRQVPQANACACPAIICSELQRSEACHVSCAQGRSAYCQCGSCNGIALRGCPKTFSHRRRAIKRPPGGNDTEDSHRERVYAA
jgi:hypothetical protein